MSACEFAFVLLLSFLGFFSLLFLHRNIICLAGEEEQQTFVLIRADLCLCFLTFALAFMSIECAIHIGRRGFTVLSRSPLLYIILQLDTWLVLNTPKCEAKQIGLSCCSCRSTWASIRMWAMVAHCCITNLFCAQLCAHLHRHYYHPGTDSLSSPLNWIVIHSVSHTHTHTRTSLWVKLYFAEIYVSSGRLVSLVYTLKLVHWQTLTRHSVSV